MLDPERKEQIEELLGRPLTADELVEVPSLEELPPAVRRVAATLVEYGMPLCAAYLRSVTPIRGHALKQFIGDLRDKASS